MKNPYELWERYHLDLPGEEGMMKSVFESDNPQTGGVDTETTGLHIIKDKPFLIQFGWLVPKKDFGRAFTFYPTPENMSLFFDLAKQLKYMVAHNIKYDLNMLSNIGYAEQVQSMTNLVDNMAVARLSLEAIPAREGGDSLALKSLGAKYVHPDAVKSEHIIKEELRKLNAERIKVLSAALKQFDMEGEFTATGKPKKWGKGAIEKFLKDPTNDVDLLPDDVKDVWIAWQEEYPEPTYEDVDRDIMIKYGAEDIITMLEFFKKAYPYLVQRKQLPILQLEMDCILPTYRMERVGLKVDQDYLETSRQKVQSYIKELRNEMYSIIGERITVNQHARIKQVYKDKWGIELISDDAEAMKKITEHKEFPQEAKRLATLIKLLRSLEKWYSTYIKRLIKNAEYDGHVYTQINLNSAVSGRMSSDLQQNPKHPLLDEKGDELFHPRKAFIVDKEKFECNAYVDFSQVELRVTAHFSILVSGGDVNLCRAYMPFKCHHYQTGEVFKYKDLKDRMRWDEKQTDGQSAWVLENGEPWTPTDMHSETTHNALILLGYLCRTKYKDYINSNSNAAFGNVIDGVLFKDLRGTLGKRFNFSKTYGVGLKTAMKNLDVSEEVAQALIDGYTAAFPGIIAYQKAIERAHAAKGYIHNVYGMRYYLSDQSKSYKLANHNVQGSCALGLKVAITELDKYIRENNLKSRLVLPVHDEEVFGVAPGESKHIESYIRIMQGVMNKWSLIPILSEPEVSYTTWANKKEWSGGVD